MVSAALQERHSKQTLVAQALQHDIETRKYSVGDTLPGEHVLCEMFGVSRHTVRAALRALQDKGLITSQQGVGSIVNRDRVSQDFVQSFSTAEDLLQYVQGSEVLAHHSDELTLDESTARWLGCKTGERWVHATVLRGGTNANRSRTLADVYLPYAYSRLLSGPKAFHTPIFLALEQQFGESISEIRQEIAAALANAREAEGLHIAEGDPVLIFVRRYYGANGQVLEATRTIHAARTFTYTMNIRTAANRPSRP